MARTRVALLSKATTVGLAVVALTAGCGGDASTSADAHPGRQVLDELGCASCHGARLDGTRTAPPLADLESHWQADALVAYLQSPAQVARATPNIAYRNERYPLQMPSFGHVDEAKLRQLAEFLMSR